jgi:hypothetical protein
MTVPTDLLAGAGRLRRINNLLANALEREARTKWPPWQVFAVGFTGAPPWPSPSPSLSPWL